MDSEFARVKKIVGGVVVGILCLMLLLSSWAVVPPGHRGVVIHAGKVQEQVLDEGFTFKAPLYTTVHIISIRVRQSVITTTAASKDLQKVHTTVAINWHISPDKVMTVFQQLGDDDVIDQNVIEKAASEVLKAATAKMTAEEILSRRIELKNSIDQELITRLGSFNLLVDVVNLSDFDFDPKFNQAVEDKQIAEQRAKQAVYEAEQATQSARAEVEKAKGQAEAQRLLKQTITAELIQKLAVEKWDGKLPSVMLSREAMPFLNINQSAH